MTARGAAETFLMVAGVTGLGLAAAPMLPATAIDLLYLVPVLAAASLHGSGAGLLAAAAGAVAYNFFFTEPIHSLRMRDPGDVVTVVVLLGVALFTGRLAAQLRAQARAAEVHAADEAALAAVLRALVDAGDVAALGGAICREVGRLFNVNAMLVAGSPPELLAAEPGPGRLDGFDAEAAALAIATGQPAGRGTGVIPAADWTYRPLATARGVVGALGLAREDGRVPVPADRLQLLAAVMAPIALALERQRLAAEAAELDGLRERDRLRGALLASVGHDLRTPLTAVLAAAAQLRRGEGDDGILATLDAEAHRLDRYIANLLDMARIEAGAVRLRIEPVDLTDAVTAAVRDSRSSGAPAPRVAVPVDLPLVRIDPQLLHHCLINLLDNAARHGRGGPIEVVATSASGGVELAVLDRGPGLPAGTATRIFETFARLEGGDRRGGAGLGLAIVKGFAEAMGGEVRAANRDGGGAAFVLRFPAALLVDPAVEAAG